MKYVAIVWEAGPFGVMRYNRQMFDTEMDAIIWVCKLGWHNYTITETEENC